MGPFRTFQANKILLSGLLLFSIIFPCLFASAQVPYGGDGNSYFAGIASDASGNIYGIGTTNATVFPQMTGAQTTAGGNNDAFLEKFDSQLALLKGTFFGGSGNEWGDGIVVGPDGKVYITGRTNSPNLPGAINGNDGTQDAFLAKVEPDLMSVTSVYLGGTGEYSGTDQANAIVVDTDGNVYIAGWTNAQFMLGAQCFPAGQYTSSFFVGKFDARLSLLGSACVPIGGMNRGVSSIARDGSGNIFVAGWTDSAALPKTAGGSQAAYGGGTYDGFIMKFDPTLFHVRSTYFGGPARDWIRSLAIDASGKVYAGGETGSTAGQSIPGTANGAQPTYGGGGKDGFIARFSNDLSQVEEATFLGGLDDDIVYDVKLDPQTGDVFAAGSTCSPDFPATAGSYQPTLTPGTSAGGTCNPPDNRSSDGFASRLSPDLRAFRRSTYYGGSGNERIRSILLPGGTTPLRQPYSLEDTGKYPLGSVEYVKVKVIGATTTGSTVTDPSKCQYIPCDVPLVGMIPFDLGIPPAPKIEVTPDHLDFDTVLGTDKKELTITVRNVGTGELQLEAKGLRPWSPSCYSVRDECPAALLPLASCHIVIIFDPQTAGQYDTSFFVKSNDPSLPFDQDHKVWVEIKGRATYAGQKIQVSPGRIDFGKVPPGQKIYQVVQIRNVGNANLALQNRQIGAGAFSFDTLLPDFPSRCPVSGSLLPLQACSLIVGFTAEGHGEAVGEATITSDDPARPVVTVPLEGYTLPEMIKAGKNKVVIKDSTGQFIAYDANARGYFPAAPPDLNAGPGATVWTTRTSPNSIQALSTKSPLVDTTYTQGIVVEAAFMPPEPRFYLVVGGTWKQIYPTNECTGVSNVTLSGNTLSYTITDNGDCDATAETDVIYNIVVLGTPGNSIILYEGWNFVSLPLAPTDSAITSVLEAVSSNIRIVWAYDSATRKWLKWAPGMQAGNGVISSMEAGRGYWLYASADCVLTVTGSAPTPSVTLNQGWNLVGYTGTNGVTDADTLLSGIDGKWDLFWAWDEGWALKYSPLFPVPPYSPDFQSVVRGAAYWVRMKQGGSWGH